MKDDKHIYDDDAILKATETKQIYGKLESFGEAAEYHGIGINWGKIAILTRALTMEVREIRKILPEKYMGDTVRKRSYITSEKN